MISEQIQQIKKELEQICTRIGRKPEEVTLIAVSKTRPASDLQEAYACGIRHFGENKVQELLEKYEQLPKDIKWHMIGHLQRNKVKYIIDKVALIHSVDSLRLAETIEQEAAKKECVVSILLEVNVSGEESKYGFAVEEVRDVVLQIEKFSHVSLEGFMTVAPMTEEPEENRSIFSDLRKLSIDIQGETKHNGYDRRLLSMGMTGDYQIAVEEGATMIRLGSAIFGERRYSRCQ